MSNVKLKPCPFCGGEAELTEYALSYEVECSMCGASISYVTALCDDDDEKLSVRNGLLKAWNRGDGSE